METGRFDIEPQPPASGPTQHSPARAGGLASSAERWQAKAILLVIVPCAAIYAAISCLDMSRPKEALGAALFSLALAGIVLAAGAATRGAAALGALLAFCYGITPAWPHSLLWPLTLSLVLTLGASRVGRSRKKRQAAERFDDSAGHAGTRRTAVQVAANLGVGAVAGAAWNASGEIAAHAAMLAALAELAADTLASEIGQLSPRAPRMLLTGRVAQPGTDGAVSLLGVTAAALGSALIAGTGMWATGLPPKLGVLVALCGVGGMLLDSVLGQLLELRGWLANDAVNFLSNAAAAGVALRLAGWLVAGVAGHTALR